MAVDRVFHQGRDAAVALCGDVLIQVWEGPAHHDVLRTVANALQSLRRNEFSERRLFVLHIVARTASPPDAEGRQIAARFLGLFDHHINVTEGTGFRAALIRSALIGIALISGHRTDHVVTASLDAGLDALAKAGSRTRLADLADAVRTLRAAMPKASGQDA